MIEYLTVQQVVYIHNEMIRLHGGLEGVRHWGLLYSAVDAPKASMFGNELYPSLSEKAAAYLYHIVCNHPFNDANKRTGYSATLVFLKANNVKYFFRKEDLEELVLEVAKGKKGKESIKKFLEDGLVAQR